MKGFSLLIYFTFFLNFLSCSPSTANKEFKVLLDVLPTKIDPRHNEINLFHYINLQVFYPLIVKRNNTELSSHFLDMKKSRAINDRFSKYRLCLKKESKFSDGSNIKIEDLKDSFNEIRKIKKALAIEKLQPYKSTCLDITLGKKNLTFFDSLIGLDTTVLKKGTSHLRNPVGAGPYYVKTISNNFLKLEKSKYTKNNRSPLRIMFKKFGEDDVNRLSDYDDLNHLRAISIPKDVLESRQKFKRKINKTYMFFIKVKDKIKRKKIASCLNNIEWHRIIPLELIKTKGILPVGLHGANAAQSYDNFKSCNLKTIDFLIYRKAWSNDKRLLKALKETGFKSIKTIGPENYFKLLSKNEEFVSIVGLDSTSNNIAKFFYPFTSSSKAIFNKIDGLDSVLSRAETTISNNQSRMLFYNAHVLVLNSYYVYPIGQVVTNYFYPSNIKNIEWIESNNDYINISKLK